MSGVSLFPTKRSFLLFASFVLVLLILRLAWLYRDYRHYLSQPLHYTDATVEAIYPKTRHHKAYLLLKLRCANGWRCYTNYFGKRHIAVGDRARFKLYTNEEIGFWRFLRGFYLKSRPLRWQGAGKETKAVLVEAIAHQHKNNALASLYGALYLAVAPDRSVREAVSRLGVAHLVALSGFHLGILSAVLFALLYPHYRFVQQRYFPYRYALLDVGIVVFVVLGFYLALVGAPPSLLRAYMMSLIAWAALLMGVRVVDFSLLAVTVLLLLALFPRLLVSLSFWLSVAGVFYIFLLLRHFAHLGKWQLTLVVIPFGIFFLMQPIAHLFFVQSSPYQLLSPLLSLLFIPFYPLSLLLHLVGHGDLFDGALESLFALPKATTAFRTPLWAALPYIALSLFAIRRKSLLYLLLLCSLLFTLFLFYHR